MSSQNSWFSSNQFNFTILFKMSSVTAVSVTIILVFFVFIRFTCVLQIFFALSMVVSAVFGGILPYASSYNAHTVNHAIATPFVQAAPIVAAPAPAFVARQALPVPAQYAALPASLISPYSYNAFPYAF